MKTKETGFKVENGRRTETFYSKEEPKQETLEEVAEQYYEDEVSINAFINGAKWQQERMYSEEDMQSFIKIRNYFGENDKTSIEHFAYSFLDGVIEQFKNK